MVFGTIDHGSIPCMGFTAVGTHATDLHGLCPCDAMEARKTPNLKAVGSSLGMNLSCSCVMIEDDLIPVETDGLNRDRHAVEGLHRQRYPYFAS